MPNLTFIGGGEEDILQLRLFPSKAFIYEKVPFLSVGCLKLLDEVFTGSLVGSYTAQYLRRL